MIGAKEMIKKHEGRRLKPYTCSAGKLTIGYGRNLEDNGITEDEAEYLLNNDIGRVKKELHAAFPWFDSLDYARQAVMIDMCYNLGLFRLKKFKKMLRAMEEGLYLHAAAEMLDSDWAEQVGSRATELAKIMRDGYT